MLKRKYLAAMLIVLILPSLAGCSDKRDSYSFVDIQVADYSVPYYLAKVWDTIDLDCESIFKGCSFEFDSYSIRAY